MESKGGTYIALKTNFSKEVTIISVATKIMVTLTQNVFSFF